nr:hypothetical protein [Tanacetum cinerariifolium]
APRHRALSRSLVHRIDRHLLRAAGLMARSSTAQRTVGAGVRRSAGLCLRADLSQGRSRAAPWPARSTRSLPALRSQSTGRSPALDTALRAFTGDH